MLFEKEYLNRRGFLLILTRKVNQSIIISDNIEIFIVETKGEQVKIGIKAPKNVSVYRTEVYKEIQNENIKAAQSQEFLEKDLTKINSLFNKLKIDNKNQKK